MYRLTWTGSPDEVQDVPDPHLKSGSLERSNVNAIDEMIHLMSAYREFEAAPEESEDTNDGYEW